MECHLAPKFLCQKNRHMSTLPFSRIGWSFIFLPRKPAGKVLLIVDGHASHTNSVEVLEFSEANDIILFCLPSHTTHYLQPLDRSFLKSLKNHYYAACNNFLKANPSRKITRIIFGNLLGQAWGKSATVENGMSCFRATGIAPFNPAIFQITHILIFKWNKMQKPGLVQIVRVKIHPLRRLHSVSLPLRHLCLVVRTTLTLQQLRLTPHSILHRENYWRT